MFNLHLNFVCSLPNCWPLKPMLEYSQNDKRWNLGGGRGSRGQQPFVKKILDFCQLAVSRFYLLISLKSFTNILENSCYRISSSNWYSEQYWAIYNSLGTNWNHFWTLVNWRTAIFCFYCSSVIKNDCRLSLICSFF